MNHLVEVDGLTKVYPGGKRAIDGISFQVEVGEIFGFLGPNGSGKTTTMRILVTLLPKSSGTVRVGKFDVDRNPEDVRRMIGYAAQFIGVDNDLTARENLILQGRLHGLSVQKAKRRSDELLETFALTEVANERANHFSGGMRRRLDLVQALVHRPPLLFLDEPTTGLDPQSRNTLWKYLDELSRDGMTIFLTTQYLEEADRLCKRIAIIDGGRIVASGSPASLKEEVGGDVITLTFPNNVEEGILTSALEMLTSSPELGIPTCLDHSIVLSVKDAGRSLVDVVRRLDEKGIPIARLGLTTPTLDEVFLKYTGQRIRKEETEPMTNFSSLFATIHGRRSR